MTEPDPHANLIIEHEALASGTAVVTFRTDSVTEPECDRFLDEITVVIRSVSPRVAIGCGRLGHISSAMLGTLIRVRNRVREADGAMVLFDLPETIRSVIALTRLDAVFDLAETRGEAVAMLERPGDGE